MPAPDRVFAWKRDRQQTGADFTKTNFRTWPLSKDPSYLQFAMADPSIAS